MSEESRTGRHPVNIGHLVMGLAFLGLVGVWAIVQGDVIDNDEIRWLRDTSFPIPGDDGAVTRIGGITEDLTPVEVRQVYIVSTKQAAARGLASLVRGLGYRARSFEGASAFLDVAPVLAPDACSSTFGEQETRAC